MNEKKGQFSNKQFVQYIMPGLKKITWYVDTRTVVKIVREEVCI